MPEEPFFKALGFAPQRRQRDAAEAGHADGQGPRVEGFRVLGFRGLGYRV